MGSAVKSVEPVRKELTGRPYLHIFFSGTHIVGPDKEDVCR